MKFIDKIELIYDRFVTALGVMVGFTIAFFALSMALDWFLRLTDLGVIRWLRDIIEYLLYAGVFLGAPWVLRNRAHVRVDLLMSSLSDNGARQLERGLNLLAFSICVFLAWLGLQLAIQLYVDNSVAQKTLAFDRWIFQAIFSFTMILLAIEFLFRVLRPKPPGRDEIRDGF